MGKNASMCRLPKPNRSAADRIAATSSARGDKADSRTSVVSLRENRYG